MNLVKRNQKIAFMEVENELKRMQKFTEISTSKNPVEYSRTYVDEEGETTDVTGYSEEKSYAFDQYTDNPVHQKIAEITDDELTGEDATVAIVVVDKSQLGKTDGTYIARKRNYAVVPDSDGDSTDAYTYSGSFKAKGNYIKGTATISDDGLTATFTPDTETTAAAKASPAKK